MIMKRKEKHNKQTVYGFTLVEMLLVVAIIGILATVVVVSFRGHGGRAKIQSTRASIQNIATAIDAYEIEKGQLPASLEELTQPAEDRAPLLQRVPVDAWGNKFQYQTKGSYEYEIRSAGPDGQFGSSDDLTN